MLLRFACSNFRSIKDRQEISFVAEPDFEEQKDSLIPVPSLGIHVVPVAAIYGANASGKTNVLEALTFFRSAINNSQAEWRAHQKIPRSHFRLDRSMLGANSSFDIDIFVENTRYHYGFECSSSVIESEWLISIRDDKETEIFSRQGNKFEFNKEIVKQFDLLKQITRDNSLVLSAGVVVNEHSIIRIVKHIVTKIIPSSVNFDGGYCAMALNHSYDAILNFVKLADQSVKEIQITSHPKTNTEPLAENNGLSVILKDAIHDETTLNNVLVDLFGNKYGFAFLRDSSDGDDVIFAQSDDSKGTSRTLEIAAPLMIALQYGFAVYIDELEASLHPHISKSIISLFSDPKTNRRGAQLIFSTHDTNLLGADLLRRDEVWFTEKDKNGATHLYPLSDIKVPEGANLQKGYLDGRFGAIPYIGDLARRFRKE